MSSPYIGTNEWRVFSRKLAWMLCGAAAVTVAGAGLAGCGGGSGNDRQPQGNAPPPSFQPPPPPAPACAPPEGPQAATTAPFAVGGTIVGRIDPSFILLTVPSPYGGQYRRIMVYGPDLAASSVVRSLIDAGDSCWDSAGATFNGWDYGIDDGYSSASQVYLRTTVDSLSTSVSGSLRTPNASYPLSGASLPGAATGYVFNRPASLDEVAGQWRIEAEPGSGGNVEATLHIDGKGVVTRSDSNAPAGVLTPSRTGVNLFDFPYSGVGLTYPLATGGQRLLLLSYVCPFDCYPVVLVAGR